MRTVQTWPAATDLAVGVPDLAAKILGVAPWTASAHVAERYRHGRTLLARDATHEMPTGASASIPGCKTYTILPGSLPRCCRTLFTVAFEHLHDGRQPIGRAVTE